MELDQPISNLIKGYRNYDVKWGSKDLNEQVLTYNRITDRFDNRDYKIMRLINDLCNNTVVCSMAISALIQFIYMEYEKAVESNDEELKYVCWVRYHKAIRLAEEMNLGSGSFGKDHATFDNINSYISKGVHSFFLFSYKKNLTKNDLDKLESIDDTFDITEERKEEIKKICGDIFDVQIDRSKDYYKEYKAV